MITVTMSREEAITVLRGLKDLIPLGNLGYVDELRELAEAINHQLSASS